MKKILLCIFMFVAFVASVNAQTVLITGFAPFGGEKINPSWQAVKQLPDTIDGAKIIKKQIPVSFRGSVNDLDKLIKEYNPDVIIAVGEAGGRAAVSIERVAINVDDARIPDNDNYQPKNIKISINGKNAYFSKLPIYQIQEAIQAQGIPAYISDSAGTYVCNHVMYHLLEVLSKKYPNKIAGFIHVPYAPEQVVDKSDMPSMSTDQATQALKIAIQTSITKQ
ncbi:pyroglutamyl-peptidase I [Francisella hispaniensis]|uniref:Pyrrolidone-carboxylate peptidase n=2 Tax=Francisella hispaniensis TaxID=622488 RepID=F4BIR0_9GAMM|nr:pyroglutamyl-peptidase I [Francisella hispaniensis]AEB28054.1 Pyrrolidone-carboxylate peptidase [Francisella hispaniensis]APD49817.1 pyroglutamyl-peptidase I [Francisella hispaniensis FSC454]KYW86393.1 pyroglutamyl-peptidase I [Francisella hispaniensis FSC454]MBK2356253.1 pyroglutamyl-peptidase I [Francisella hispaniensis]